jgi:hypothetical protein
MRKYALKKTQTGVGGGGRDIVEISKEGQQRIKKDGGDGRRIKRNTGFK